MPIRSTRPGPVEQTAPVEQAGGDAGAEAGAQIAPPRPQLAVPARQLDLDLRWELSRHGERLFYLALAGLAVGVITGRPQFIALAAPALVLLCAPRGRRPPALHLSLQPSAERIYEGEQVTLSVTATGNDDHSVDLLLRPSAGTLPVERATRAQHGHGTLTYEVPHWGHRVPGTLEVVLWDRYRLHECHKYVLLPRVTCYPAPAVPRRAVVLGRLAVRSGDHPARSPGEGAEFAGVRQYVPGDRQRSINWSATTRRGRLHVNTFAAERAQDLVLIVDATSDIGERGAGPLDHALRGALGAARAYLDARDRVGMVFVGGRMRWLAPAIGNRQFFRMAETMLEGRSGWSSGDDITRLPRAALPPGASVVAFSPLLDAGFVETLSDLRERNFSVTVVDVLNTMPRAGRGKFEDVAQRIWQMERQALIFSLTQLGTGVVHWDGKEDLVLPARHRVRPGAPVRR